MSIEKMQLRQNFFSSGLFCVFRPNRLVRQTFTRQRMQPLSGGFSKL
jgi:hypothetical protein